MLSATSTALTVPLAPGIRGRRSRAVPAAVDFNGNSHTAGKPKLEINLIGRSGKPTPNDNHLISVQTELASGFTPTDQALSMLNSQVMSHPGLAGPVLNAKMETVSLRTLFDAAHVFNNNLMGLVRTVARMQIEDTLFFKERLDTAHRDCAAPALSVHSGRTDQSLQRRKKTCIKDLPPCERPRRDLIDLTNDTLLRHVNPRIAIRHCSERGRFVVAFNHDSYSSTCEISLRQDHERLGVGTAIIHRFPGVNFTGTEGIKLALSLNSRELVFNNAIHGLGSYAYVGSDIVHSLFLPESVTSETFLTSIVSSVVRRATSTADFLARVNAR